MFSSSLFEFLVELAENNNREWFEANKPQYQQLREAFTRDIHRIAGDIAEFDEVVRSDIDHPKTVKIFRIYRDVRFSKNKTPYKINMSGSITAGQREGEPTYYLHIEPGNCFAGGGLYMPPSELLQSLREQIAENPKGLRRILNSKAFQSVFPEGLTQDGALKTAPRGYGKDHPAIDLLRLKSFAAIRHFSDEQVLDESFYPQLIQTYQALLKLNTYLRT